MYLQTRWTASKRGDAAIFHAVNRGKRSVALSLRDPAAVSALDRLLARADAVVDSFRPGVLASIRNEASVYFYL
jgi:alpha-methylacyl-CoA racemase